MINVYTTGAACSLSYPYRLCAMPQVKSTRRSNTLPCISVYQLYQSVSNCTKQTNHANLCHYCITGLQLTSTILTPGLKKYLEAKNNTSGFTEDFELKLRGKQLRLVQRTRIGHSKHCAHIHSRPAAELL